MRSTRGRSREAVFDIAAAGPSEGVTPFLRALRLAAGSGCWPLAECVLGEACGRQGAAAARLLQVLVQILALGVRRPIRLGFVAGSEITHDERVLLQAMTAARNGDPELLAGSLVWLLRPRFAEPAARILTELSRLLDTDGR